MTLKDGRQDHEPLYIFSTPLLLLRLYLLMQCRIWRRRIVAQSGCHLYNRGDKTALHTTWLPPLSRAGYQKPLFGEAQSTYEWLALVGSKFRQGKMYIVEGGEDKREREKKEQSVG